MAGKQKCKEPLNYTFYTLSGCFDSRKNFSSVEMPRAKFLRRPYLCKIPVLMKQPLVEEVFCRVFTGCFLRLKIFNGHISSVETKNLLARDELRGATGSRRKGFMSLGLCA
jgi:hypothetical protein